MAALAFLEAELESESSNGRIRQERIITDQADVLSAISDFHELYT